jgi:hypothetical protein
MNKICLYYLIFILSSFITPISLSAKERASAKQFHVLLAADTTSDVGKSARQDLKHMKKELAIIAKTTGMTLNIKELYNHKLTYKKLNNWILNKKFGKNDVVLLYYTGHGLRTEKSKSIWPAIYLPQKKEIIELNDLYQKLTKRSAALYIVFADCCNNNKKERRLLPKSICFLKEKQPSFNPSNLAYKKLFLETRGVIIASGSTPGKRAWCSEKGSIFTNSFLYALRYEFNHQDPQWGRILKNTKKICHHFQKPQFHIELKESPK